MNKSIIALAIVAALPVAAQADATLSGSVKATVSGSAATTIVSSVTLASSEVLANGMTATTSISLLTADTAKGTAGLTGDFGTLTLGSGIDDESGARKGDVAGVMGSAATAHAVNGATYSGDLAGLSVAVAHGTVTSVGATYDFNGMTVGAAQQEGVSSFGATYAFGDLTVKAGKKSGSDAVITASYSTTIDALTVKASVNNSDTITSSVAYTLDGITVTAAYDGTDTDVSASYTSGDLTVTANSDSKVTAALDLGNADLTVTRDGGATTMSYKVSF